MKKTLDVIGLGLAVAVSVFIWLPIVTWKMGLIISDNIMKHLTETNDNEN